MLAAQSVALGASLFVVLLVALLSVALPSESKASQKVALAGAILAVAIPVIFVKVYAMQCVVYGNCDRFAWIVSGAAIALALAYAALFVYRLRRSRDQLPDKKNA